MKRATADRFEWAARERKVRKMMAVVDEVIALMPKGKATPDSEAAGHLAKFSKMDRARVALIAGVGVPSDTTWSMFLGALRERGRGDDHDRFAGMIR